MAVLIVPWVVLEVVVDEKVPRNGQPGNRRGRLIVSNGLAIDWYNFLGAEAINLG